MDPRARSCTIACLLLLIPAVAAANPVGDPTAGLKQGFSLGVIAFALAAEVTVVSAVCIWLCRIWDRPPVVIAVTVLNLLSYGLFIRLLHPLIRYIVITETLIWFVEAVALLAITFQLSDKPLTPRRALAISFAGNLVSFLVGHGA